MASSKFNVPFLDDDITDDRDFKTNTGSLFKTHRQQIKTNILLSKSPKKTIVKEPSDRELQTSSHLTDTKESRTTQVSSASTNNVYSTTIATSSKGLTNQQNFKNENIRKNTDQGIEDGRTSKQPAKKASQSGLGNNFVPSGNLSAKEVCDTALTTGSKGSDIKLSPIRPSGSSKSSLIVSARQRGNPIIKFIRNVPWEYGDIVPDYEMGKAVCALYLSLRYHHLNPAYIHERLKQLGRSYDLRVLLVQVDVKDPHHSLTELAKISILSDVTLIVAFSPEEAGRYLETYKAYENKPPDLIMEKTEGDFLSQFTDCITCNRKVNKTDAMTLLNTFGSFEKVVQADEESLSLCPGLGPQKAKRLYEVLHEPFLKANKKTKSEVTKTRVSKEKTKEETQSHYFSVTATNSSTEPEPSTSGTS